MRAHQIKDGKVVNTIEVDSLDVLPNLVDASTGGKIGDLWDGATFSTPAAPVIVPDSIPALNALLAIDNAGLSQAYEAWANDPARTFAERAFITRAQVWRRDDSTLLAGAAVLGLTAAQIDALFIVGAAL